jgi:type II secretory pathway pseudopilin PulG
VEVVCVVLIIGIVSAIALPRFSNSIALRRVDAAARRVQVDLSLARRHAKVSTTSQRVTFDTAANSYLLVGMTDPDHSAAEYMVSLSDEPYSATIVSAAFGGDAEIIFDGWGAPDSGGSVLIQVGSHQKTIDVDPDTGQASVP